MKHFLTLFATIIMVMTAMAQNAGIVLSYNKGSELKFYSYDQLHKVIEDAEVNDTVYFGSGTIDISVLPTYNNNYQWCQINKPLTFIGAGAQEGGTKLSGNKYIFLNIDPSLDHMKKVFSFEGIEFPSDRRIMPSSDLRDLKFVNVKSGYIDKGNSQEKTFVVDNLIIDRCSFYQLSLKNFSTKKATINNTKIAVLEGGCDSSGVATLEHCSISRISSDVIGLIKYSLYETDFSGTQCVLENCFRINSDLDRVDDNPSSLGKCDDGTVYGTLGGQTPYTLFPQYPTPDTSIDSNTGKPKSYVEYDSLNKKLTITVKRIGE
ncbi:MAG: hypothetical protein K2N09_01955 [Muribaculaceae bacterium]|nr:hypothetical protein [Muribaculaceae bacterium]